MTIRALLFFALLPSIACSGGPTQDIPYDPVEGAAQGAWAAFRNDPARTGYSPTANTGRVAEELWRVEDINTTDYGAAKGSPSVEGDVVYVGSDDARFQAFDRATGEKLWGTVLEETSQGIHGSPAIGGEHVYIGGYNGILYAFDKASGDEVWRYEMGYQIGASPVLVPEHGRVYNTHERSNRGGGHIVAVDARTGEEIWNYNVRAHPHSSVAVSVERDLLFVGDNLAILHAIDTRSGDKVWDYQLPQTDEDQADIKTTPTVVEEHGLVVVGAWSRKVHAFDMESGEIVWEYETGDARIMGSTAYAPGRGAVYVGSLSPARALHAIDVETGEELWTYEVNSSVMSSPAVNADESLVVFGAHNGHLYAVDAETGELAWRHEVGGTVSGSPALYEDQVFITAKGGDLVAISTSEPN